MFCKLCKSLPTCQKSNARRTKIAKGNFFFHKKTAMRRCMYFFFISAICYYFSENQCLTLRAHTHKEPRYLSYIHSLCSVPLSPPGGRVSYPWVVRSGPLVHTHGGGGLYRRGGIHIRCSTVPGQNSSVTNTCNYCASGQNNCGRVCHWHRCSPQQSPGTGVQYMTEKR